MKLTNLTLEEKNNLLNDMDLFGYFDHEEIQTMIDEKHLDDNLINKVGTYLSEFKNQNKKNFDFDKQVYNYITNIDDIQTIVRRRMNKIIMESQDMLKHYIEIALNNNILISDRQIQSILLKWYNNLYDLAGILEDPCLQIVLNNGFTTDYDEQICDMMLNVVD